VTALLGRYRFQRVAGTSAGAVVAALVAAGLDADGLRAAGDRLDYARVPDSWAPVPLLAPAAGLLLRAGLHPGRYLQRWLEGELAALGVRTFGDLRHDDPGADPNLAPFQRYRRVVMAADVTRGRLLRLPWDYHEYGLDPDTQPVADAVRASAAIPLFFAPSTLTDAGTGRRSTLVDGGVLSNFPVEVFDRTDAVPPRWPTFGVRVSGDLDEEPALFRGTPVRAVPPLRLVDSVVATAVVGRDRTYLDQPCVRRRTVAVDTRGVGPTDFDVPAAERARLVAAGERAAADFLAGWDVAAYLRECRGVPEPTAAPVSSGPPAPPR
jgi:NTE family protein